MARDSFNAPVPFADTWMHRSFGTPSEGSTAF